MANFKEWIIQNNRYSAPLLAILFSSIVTVMGVYFLPELLFLIPVVTFITFHYTKLYRFKLRLLAGTIVFIVVAFLATGLLTNAVYSAQPTYQTQFLDSTNNTTGINVIASVSPYSGSSPVYSFVIYVIPNGTLNFSTISLNIHGSSGNNIIVPYSELKSTSFSGNDTQKLTYPLTNIPSGIYSYNLTAQQNGTLHTVEISGPINTSEFIVYTYLLPSYAIYYLIIFELIFIAGLFIARSISHSRRYTPPAPPEQKE